MFDIIVMMKTSHVLTLGRRNKDTPLSLERPLQLITAHNIKFSYISIHRTRALCSGMAPRLSCAKQ